MVVNRRTIKDTVTTAAALLPCATVVAVVLWWWRTPPDAQGVAGLALALAATMLSVATNGRLQLLRVRSLAVSSVFILLIGVSGALHHWLPEGMVVTLLFMVYLLCLLSSYVSRRPQVPTFVAMVSLAVLTLRMPLLVCLVPVALAAMLTVLRTLSLRTLLATLFGFGLVYEVWLVWHGWHGTLWQELGRLQEGLTLFSVPWPTEGVAWPADGAAAWVMARDVLTSPVVLYLLPLAVYGSVGMAHYFRTSYNDKIRVRMFYTTIILHWLALLLLTLFVPGETTLCLLLLTACSAPLLARYFVFARGWLANLMFWLFVALCLFLALHLS